MKCVVLLSGGQDSTTSLFWAKEMFDEIFAVIINYGQKHKIEIDSAIRIANEVGIEYDVIDLPFIKKIGNSALVDENSDVNLPHKNDAELPSSFVPGRNLIFITVASMVAYKYNAKYVVTGVCQTDYSGYPDCRLETINALTKSIRLGMGVKDFFILTPLMYLTKAQTVKLAQKFDGCMEALKFSHTCYNGVFPPCGECASCKLRAKGFEEAGVTDPLIERNQNV